MGMQIGEVAEKVGMAPSAIRSYEEIGLWARSGGREADASSTGRSSRGSP